MYVLPAVRPQPKQPSLWCFKDFLGDFLWSVLPVIFVCIFLGSKSFDKSRRAGSTWEFPSPTCTKQLKENVKDPPGYWKRWNIGVSESLLAGQTQMQCLLIHPICWIQCIVCTKHYLMSEVANFISCPEILRWIWTRSCVNGKNVCTLPIASNFCGHAICTFSPVQPKSAWSQPHEGTMLTHMFSRDLLHDQYTVSIQSPIAPDDTRCISTGYMGSRQLCSHNLNSSMARSTKSNLVSHIEHARL